MYSPKLAGEAKKARPRFTWVSSLTKRFMGPFSPSMKVLMVTPRRVQRFASFSVSVKVCGDGGYSRQMLRPRMMGGRLAVRYQDDLPVGGVLPIEEPPGRLQAGLDVGEGCRNAGPAARRLGGVDLDVDEAQRMALHAAVKASERNPTVWGTGKGCRPVAILRRRCRTRRRATGRAGTGCGSGRRGPGRPAWRR